MPQRILLFVSPRGLLSARAKRSCPIGILLGIQPINRPAVLLVYLYKLLQEELIPTLSLHELVAPRDDTILLVLLRQLGDAVAHKRPVHAHVPTHIFHLQHRARQLEFKPKIHHFTNVPILLIQTNRQR